MNKLIKFLFSTKTMAVLLILYAVAMGGATFVEDYYDTATAKVMIYESWWFEALMLWLIVIFIMNISRYNLLKKSKLPILIFHLSFVFIFIGGAITRYISFEGTMYIGEGETTNKIISADTYFKLYVTDGNQILVFDKNKYVFTHFDSKEAIFPFKRSFKSSYTFNGNEIKLRTLDYIPMAKDSIVKSGSGKKMIEVITMGQKGRQSIFIEEGQMKEVSGTMFSFNSQTPGTVQLFETENQIMLRSPLEGSYISMEGMQVGVVSDSAKLAENSGIIHFDSIQPINYRTLYNINHTQFIITQPAFKGYLTYFSGDKANPDEKNLPGAIAVELSSGGEKDTLIIKGQAGSTRYDKATRLNGMDIAIGYGSNEIETPFSIRLDDFILDRYPGSTSPSSFESEITVIDEGKEEPHHIYMNNVMDYKGYRFFQSSYFPDETGTVLSVNKDRWGTNITYLGYFFLFFGMFATLFWKGTRFLKLNSSLKKMNKKLLVPILFISTFSFAQNAHQTKMADADSLAKTILIPKEHANKYGELLVLDNVEGRIKPINTQSLELLRKIYKKDNYHGLTPEQVFLSVQINPPKWKDAPIIRVNINKGGSRLKELTKANDEGYTSLINLVDLNTTRYVLDEAYNEAFSKRAADRTKFDDEVISVTERFNIFDNMAKGYFFRSVPIKNDPSESWTSWIYSGKESPVEIDTIALNLIGKYFDAVVRAEESGNWSEADKELKTISDYQQHWGKNVVPSSAKVKMEIFYNKSDIFFYSMIIYGIGGLLLVIMGFVEVLTNREAKKKLMRRLVFAVLIMLWATLLIHGIGLAMRWYISGHAPWSDGYEAIVFISWVGVLAGTLFYRNSNAFIPAAGALVAVIMMGFAHGSSLLDPQITPLQPVLKSYWLIIHVGIITASYAFFGLSAIMSIITLVLMIFKSTKKIKRSLVELTTVNEMSNTVGIFALTIGTFLGGMWANESWGRYWSWDPKETWAFVSVIVYAIVLHLRLVPGFQSKWWYNASSMWAIWTVIMTYFGVNYYLSGLHSYAAGDPLPEIPIWIKLTIVGMILLTIVSYLRFNKNYKKGKKHKSIFAKDK